MFFFYSVDIKKKGNKKMRQPHYILKALWGSAFLKKKKKKKKWNIIKTTTGLYWIHPVLSCKQTTTKRRERERETLYITPFSSSSFSSLCWKKENSLESLLRLFFVSDSFPHTSVCVWTVVVAKRITT